MIENTRISAQILSVCRGLILYKMEIACRREFSNHTDYLIWCKCFNNTHDKISVSREYERQYNYFKTL